MIIKQARLDRIKRTGKQASTSVEKPLRLSSPARAFDFLEALILVLDLHRHAIVEALELPAQRRDRLVGLLDFDAQLLEALGHVASRLLADRFRRGLRRWRGNRAAQIRLRGGELLAKFHPGPADALVEADHLGAEIGAQGIHPIAVLADLIGDEADLAADLGELAEDLFLQFVDFSAEAGDRLDHQLEPRAELLEHRANSV